MHHYVHYAPSPKQGHTQQQCYPNLHRKRLILSAHWNRLFKLTKLLPLGASQLFTDPSYMALGSCLFFFPSILLKMLMPFLGDTFPPNWPFHYFKKNFKFFQICCFTAHEACRVLTIWVRLLSKFPSVPLFSLVLGGLFWHQLPCLALAITSSLGFHLSPEKLTRALKSGYVNPEHNPFT